MVGDVTGLRGYSAETHRRVGDGKSFFEGKNVQPSKSSRRPSSESRVGKSSSGGITKLVANFKEWNKARKDKNLETKLGKALQNFYSAFHGSTGSLAMTRGLPITGKNFDKAVAAYNLFKKAIDDGKSDMVEKMMPKKVFDNSDSPISKHFIDGMIDKFNSRSNADYNFRYASARNGYGDYPQVNDYEKAKNEFRVGIRQFTNMFVS